MGYWTGYAVGSDAIGKTAATVAAASEKTPTQVAQEQQALIATIEPEPAEAPAQIEQPAPEPAAGPADGLHLQVSALSNEKAASDLRRELESRGFRVRVEAPSEDKLVRVYVGPISDADDLSALSSELRKEGLDPFPKRL